MRRESEKGESLFENFTRAHLQSTPFAVLYSYELVSEADFLGKLLQQIDAKSATALIKALILLCRLNIHSVTEQALVNSHIYARVPPIALHSQIQSRKAI